MKVKFHQTCTTLLAALRLGVKTHGTPGRRLFFISVLIVTFCALPGCSPKIVERIVTEIRDTTIVEIHERIVHDTARVEIPFIKEVNVTRDTSSHLENDYAISDAWVEDGILHHSLQTKPQTIDAPVEVSVADTTTTHEHYEKTDSTAIEIVEVEKPLSPIQKAKIGAFPWLVGAVLLLLLWVFRKPITNILKLWLK